MNKKLGLLLLVIIAISGCGKKENCGINNDDQIAKDEAIKEEISMGYDIENPLVIVNPYGTSPLSAIVAFDTDEEAEVKMTVKGHSSEDDISTSFEKCKKHILPVWGLYPNEDNVVELEYNGDKYDVRIHTDSIDDSYTIAEVNVIDEESYEYDKLTFVSGSTMERSAAYDSKGELRWYSEYHGMPLKKLSNGHFITETLETPSDEPIALSSSGMVEIDLLGREYNKYYVPGGVHHDCIEIKNGNLLICSGHEDKSKINCRVVEVDRKTGNIVWDLDMCDLIDPTDGAGIYQTEQNWFHNNGLAYDEDRDLLLLSSRQTDSVVAVRRKDKKIAWILGDPNGWKTVDKSLFFTPTSEDFNWQYSQHNCSFVGEDKILLFDNGCARVKTVNQEEAISGKDAYSRAVMYKINTDDMTIEQVWEYGKERGDSWYSSYISGVFYDENTDSFWIDAGGIRYDPEEQSYDVPLFVANEAKVIESYSIIDNVSGDKLLFELVLHNNSFRCIREQMYDSITNNYDLNINSLIYGKVE